MKSDSELWLKLKFRVHFETFNFRTTEDELTWNPYSRNTYELNINDIISKTPSRITRKKN